MKNFLPTGNITQTVNFDDSGLTLVLGDNLDQGSNGSRNGAGKTTLLHAISYALFGESLSNSIRKDNLVNKINSKNMMISLEFEKAGQRYKIERGRKPYMFKYIVNDKEIKTF